MQITSLATDIFTIEGFWSKRECEEFIAKSEAIGYEAATVETEKGQVVLEGVRNNSRILYKDEDLAQYLWRSLKDYAPPRIGLSVAVGLNELFRFYKYGPGEQFKKHRDQSYIRNAVEASYYTFMIYLNDDYVGGATTFLNTMVEAKQGMALLFRHDLEHAGSPVKSGLKYILRTDIMYRLDEASAG